VFEPGYPRCCGGGTAETGETGGTATGFTDIAADGGHSCAIRADQTIACWGDNEFGESDAPSGV